MAGLGGVAPCPLDASIERDIDASGLVQARKKSE
jgi:hypothetical protein